jgi:hypothetical protein
MNRSKFIYIGIAAVIFIIGIVLFVNKNQAKPSLLSINSSPAPQENKLTVISTKPDPLENTTILPTQDIEITLNKEIPISEFKHHFDPDVEHDIEIIKGPSSSLGATIKIKFRKPLELGAGYTLIIESSTRTNDHINLDHEYMYHFKTIQYKGV